MAQRTTTHPIEAETLLHTSGTKVFAIIGRILLGLAFLAVFEAWLVPFVGGTILGMNQQHLFSDAIVPALLVCGFLIDALLHSKGM